jgi:surfactin synthase thioesterase subunit
MYTIVKICAVKYPGRGVRRSGGAAGKSAADAPPPSCARRCSNEPWAFWRTSSAAMFLYERFRSMRS